GHLGAATLRRSTAVPGRPVAVGRQPWRVRTGWKVDCLFVERVRPGRSLCPAVSRDRREFPGVSKGWHEAIVARRRQGDLLSLARWHDDGCRRQHGQWVLRWNPRIAIRERRAADYEPSSIRRHERRP